MLAWSKNSEPSQVFSEHTHWPGYTCGCLNSHLQTRTLYYFFNHGKINIPDDWLEPRQRKIPQSFLTIFKLPFSWLSIFLVAVNIRLFSSVLTKLFLTISPCFFDASVGGSALGAAYPTILPMSLLFTLNFPSKKLCQSWEGASKAFISVVHEEMFWSLPVWWEKIKHFIKNASFIIKKAEHLLICSEIINAYLYSEVCTMQPCSLM